MLEDIWVQIEPAVANLLVVTILAVLGSAAVAIPLLIRRGLKRLETIFEEKTKIEIDEKLMVFLHTAIDSGVNATIERIRSGLMDPNRANSVNAVLEHVHASIKDTMAALDPDPKVLENLILAGFQRNGQTLAVD